MAKLKDAGIYVPKDDEGVVVGMTTTSKVPEKLAHEVDSKQEKAKQSNED